MALGVPRACSYPATQVSAAVLLLEAGSLEASWCHLSAPPSRVGSCFRSSQAFVFPSGGAYLVRGNPSAMKLVVLELGAEPSC